VTWAAEEDVMEREKMGERRKKEKERGERKGREQEGREGAEERCTPRHWRWSGEGEVRNGS
jgi:hypothetical protein